jgi:hypothetical protein
MHRYITNEYDRRFLNKRGFILGGGPSILENIKEGFNFKLLKDEITLGVNKAYKLIIPRYLVFGDLYFWDTYKEEVRNIKCTKISPDYNSRRAGSVDQDIFLTKGNMKNDLGSLLTETFSKEISAWNNSGVWALRLAYIFGLNPIYLIGIDVVKWDDKGNTHFHKDYNPDRVKAVSDKRYKSFFLAWSRTISLLKKKNIQMFSCSKISKLNDIIPYINIKDIELK